MRSLVLSSDILKEMQIDRGVDVIFQRADP